jgi:hypothetical protein
MEHPKPRRPWRNSVASTLLMQDFKDGAINDETTPRDAYNLRPEYQHHDYEQFCARLNDYKKRTNKKKLQSQLEVEAMHHDIQHHAINVPNERPSWESSEAQSLIREVVQAGTDRLMLPQQRWLSNEAYQAFELETFRQHISQERRRQKFLRWLNNNNNSQT